MKIYTKTGDEGKTGLIGGTRVSKNDIRIEAYGTIDELNSFIGLLVSHNPDAEEYEFLERIQHKLFAVGSYLATDTSKIEINEASIVQEADVIDIENEIDKLNTNLPELTNFILPGGSIEASLCHICRTVSRRAERRIIDLDEAYSVDSQVSIYVNRLSDYFFVLSRFVSLKNHGKEILWKKHY